MSSLFLIFNAITIFLLLTVAWTLVEGLNNFGRRFYRNLLDVVDFRLKPSEVRTIEDRVRYGSFVIAKGFLTVYARGAGYISTAGSGNVLNKANLSDDNRMVDILQNVIKSVEHTNGTAKFGGVFTVAVLTLIFVPIAALFVLGLPALLSLWFNQEDGADEDKVEIKDAVVVERFSIA